jgi:hypothetical protein
MASERIIVGSSASGLARFGFLNVFTPGRSKKFPANPPRFTVIGIIPKDHPQVDIIKAAAKKVTETTWPVAKSRPKLNNPLRDGDTDKPDNPAYAGMYFFTANASEDQPPGVVTGRVGTNGGLEPAGSKDWGAGDYGRVSIDLYGSTKYDKLCIGLYNVQFLKKGEPLSSYADASSEFEVESIETADDDSRF